MMGYRYGGFWRRWMAYFIDKTILIFIYTIIIVLELAIIPLSPYSRHPNMPAGIWGEMSGPFLLGHFLVYVGICMAYFTYFHGACGQTPGKVLLKLRVIQVTGENLTYGVAFLRWLGSIICRIPLYLGFFWIVCDGRKQGWHDKIAATLVVSKTNGGYQA